MAHRQSRHLLRVLPKGAYSISADLSDFSSNDYLGFSASEEIYHRVSNILAREASIKNGATGSRLLTGNHPLYSKLEQKLTEFHESESALVFNSGYDANIGFFGCVPQRADVVFYDEYIHASIRDGIGLGRAKSYKFKHNDLADLKKKIGSWEKRNHKDALEKPATIPISANTSGETKDAEVYVVTESVFSMDGDSPDLKALCEYCRNHGYHLIIDEAHAVGVFGERGEGRVQELGLQDAIFARIVTFGKALGCHGAAVLGSTSLKSYLVNFARSLIYSTGLSPHSIATIFAAYEVLTLSDLNKFEEKHQLIPKKQHAMKREVHPQVSKLRQQITLFNQMVENHQLQEYFIPSTSAIHSCIIRGSEKVRTIAERIRVAGFDVKAILSPTVPEGLERIRICIHSYNTEEDMRGLLGLLSEAIKNYGPPQNQD